MCLLNDSDDYGVLRWPLSELARAASVPIKLLQELVDKRVLKGSDGADIDEFIYIPRSGRKNGNPVTLVPAQPGPLWYSSRMVKDEYIRRHSGKATRFGAKDDQQDDGSSSSSSPSRRQSDEQSDNQGVNQGDGSSSSSSSSSSVNKEAVASSCDFSTFWIDYGKKLDKAKCEKVWGKIRDPDKTLIMERLPAYLASTPEIKFRKNPLTWLNGKCWNDEIETGAAIGARKVIMRATPDGNEVTWTEEEYERLKLRTEYTFLRYEN